MRILCTSDIHAHNFSDFSHTILVKWNDTIARYQECGEPEDVDHNIKDMNSRLFNILNAMCDMGDYCIKNEISDVFFAGDLFHHRGTIDVTVFNTVYKVLESFGELGIKVHAIAGNHDQTDNSIIPTSALHPFKELIHVIEKPEYFQIKDGVEVVAVPYSKDKEFVINSMKNLREQCKNPDNAILMCHLGVTGATVGSGMHVMNDEYSLKDLMYKKWKYVVVGHYHQPQLLEYNSFYCGTPVQNNFGDELPGEDGYNGFFVIDTDKRWDIHFEPIIAPRFITVSSVEELESLDAEFIKRNYIRVKSGSSQVDKIQDKLEEMLGDDTQSVRLELEKDYSVESRSDVSVVQSPEETIETYARERWENKDTLSQAIACGVEILSGVMTRGNN